MRTAEEIVQQGFSLKPYIELEIINNMQFKGSRVIELIKEGMKETIEECAKRAKVQYICYGLNDDAGEDWVIDKESILSLINELK